MIWEYVLFGEMKALRLCLEASFNGEHLEKWNKSSYFKVGVQVEELIVVVASHLQSIVDFSLLPNRTAVYVHKDGIFNSDYTSFF